MSAGAQIAPTDTNGSVAKSWARALELTAPIARNPERVLSTVIEELAERHAGSLALMSDSESLTYGALMERANRYARWAMDQGLAKGDVVCLLMMNRPEYLAIWLGLTSVGCIAGLLNWNLSGAALAHCVGVAAPRHLIVDAASFPQLETARPHLETSPKIWTFGESDGCSPRLDIEVNHYSGGRLGSAERRELHISDRALYIYTSGTTGLPKAASVSHARMLQWSYWFAGMANVGPVDRLYNCLPMYHSVGGILAPCSTLLGGGSVVLRERFSTSQFWSDIVRWDCTIFQYIGEMCRYLLHTSVCAAETQHRIRMACGNGLASQVWDDFGSRFRIPRIFEFYAATEGTVSLFNIEGKTGAIGRVPAYLRHRFSPTLVQFDFEAGEPVRDQRGLCIRCAPGEAGEAISKLDTDLSNIGSRFEGYTSRDASEKKLLRNVFEVGDTWVRSGDLMRRDRDGFFYFVDRIGDTFRWKGENVAASEVADALSVFPGVRHATVYGVKVPGTEGRAGMAALVSDGELDLVELRKHLDSRLPNYACPLFLRIRGDVDLTGTMKYSKTETACQGYDPTGNDEAIYFNHREAAEFVRLDKALYDRIQNGGFRL